MRLNQLLLAIITSQYLLFIPIPASAELWDLVLDQGQGSGSCSLSREQDGTITADGNWNYNYKGTFVFGPYVDAPVTINGRLLSIKATGTAINTSAPPGYNTSPFVLTINGNAFDGSGEGTFEITFRAFGWPYMISGAWQGTRTDGGGITAEPKAMPWLYLLLRN